MDACPTQKESQQAIDQFFDHLARCILHLPGADVLCIGQIDVNSSFRHSILFLFFLADDGPAFGLKHLHLIPNMGDKIQVVCPHFLDCAVIHPDRNFILFDQNNFCHQYSSF